MAVIQGILRLMDFLAAIIVLTTAHIMDLLAIQFQILLVLR